MFKVKRLILFCTISLTSCLMVSKPSLANNPYCEGKAEENFKVAVEAGVEEANRQTESVVYSFCERDFNHVQHLINLGLVTENDVLAIAQYMEIDFNPKPRTMKGRLYEAVYVALSQMNITMFVAKDAASQYADNPNSRTGKLVERALRGDEKAIDILRGKYD